MRSVRFFPGAEDWPLAELQRELDLAAANYAARRARGSSADSERMCVLELAELLGQHLNDAAAEGEADDWDGDWNVDEPIPFYIVGVEP